jgi:hypothetical protein
LALSAVDSITPALEHTREQLFRPFRIGQWTRLAFVGLLAGELGVHGCNRSNFQFPAHPGVTPHIHFPGSLGVDYPLLIALMASALVAGFAIGIIIMYISSVMRFVLFDGVVTRECHIRQEWNRRIGEGWRYFVWRLGYLLLSLAAVVIVLGIPAALAYFVGWFREPKEHLAGLIFAGGLLAILLLAFAIATAVVLVLTKDFVVPQMALENIDAMEGWRRLWLMMKPELGSYAAYIVMKIVLAIVTGILMAVATLILGLIMVVPSIGIGILAVITGKTAGLTWNVHTIALAVAIGCVLLATFLYLASLIYVPAIVFFPAYSIYFFAARYPRLAAVMYGSPASAIPRGIASAQRP